MKKISALFLLLLLASGTVCFAEIAQTTLDNLLRVSQYAVIGRVTRVIDVEGTKIAEAQVLMTLKGDSRKRTVYFVGDPIGFEDTSRAVLNETAILFLVTPPSGIDESSSFGRRQREAIGSNKLWRIAWSGRGRLPITRIGATNYLRVAADPTAGDVRFPRSLTTIPSSEPNNDSVRLTKLDDIVKFLRKVQT